jgi:hypothetical protein
MGFLPIRASSDFNNDAFLKVLLMGVNNNMEARGGIDLIYP